MSKLGTILANSTGSIKLTYIPEVLVLKAADLTKIDSLKLNVFGVGVIADLNQKGLQAFDAFGQTNEDDQSIVIALANGKFLATEGELTITNSQASNVEVFGFGTRKGTHFISYVTEKYVGGNTATFTKFLGLAMPDVSASDIITSKMNVYDDYGNIVDKFDEILSREEIRAISTAYNHKPQYALYNGNQLYSKVEVYCSQDQTFYYSRIIDPTLK